MSWSAESEAELSACEERGSGVWGLGFRVWSLAVDLIQQSQLQTTRLKPEGLG